ncbi:N-acetyltransferase GCN5 [Pseudomonas sp. 8Z]|uniref:GNAT family N-acetyltransferase n=1 Tax=Pseudomonas sp. 8Z TaxID=2653166 RepID=UPI0012F1F62E|nr:GNAT family N-acetyltransferase [Pseudomonas sp. 8Z]VXC98320.1 N-acetyltransferase GCN5 [Pseudomonas sp. 8Z]
MPVTAAVAADLADLTRLFAAYLCFYEVPRPAVQIQRFLAARLQQGDSQLLIARDALGHAQGFVQLYPLQSSLALAPAWLLSDLYVDEAARRCGVGEALMNAARTHAEASGACGLQLETARTNLAGQRLYERLGYIRDEQFFTYWLPLSG